MSRLRRFLCVLLSFVIVVVTALGCALATSAADKDFETQLNAFPESYRSALRALHAA